MKLLLDTHIWLWSLDNPDRLSTNVASALRDGTNETWLSPVSVWETSVLNRKGRLHLAGGSDAWFRQALSRAHLHEAPLTMDVALAAGALNLNHHDPADRFLLATAKVFGLTLVTADKLLIESGAVDVLANR